MAGLISLKMSFWLSCLMSPGTPREGHGAGSGGGSLCHSQAGPPWSLGSWVLAAAAVGTREVGLRRLSPSSERSLALS